MDLPPNSRKAAAQARPPEPKRVERVTSAPAEVRKKSLGRKFRETFISGSARTAMMYGFTEVVVPAARDMLYDAVQEGWHRLIYGEGSMGRRRGSSQPPPGYGYSTPPRVDYRGYSTPTTASTQANPRALSRAARSRHSFGEIVIASRPEADEVISMMFTILDKYGSVSVADLYELTGIQASHTDVRYGWTALPGAKPIRLKSGQGYLLDLPDPQPLGQP